MGIRHCRSRNGFPDGGGWNLRVGEINQMAPNSEGYNVERTFRSGLLIISPMKSFASSFLRTFATFRSGGPDSAHMLYRPLCFTAPDGSSRALPCPGSVGSITALNGPLCVRFAIRRSRSFSCEVTTGLDRDISGLENTAGTAERCERTRVDVRGFFVLSVCRTSGKSALEC